MLDKVLACQLPLRELSVLEISDIIAFVNEKNIESDTVAKYAIYLSSYMFAATGQHDL